MGLAIIIVLGAVAEFCVFIVVIIIVVRKKQLAEFNAEEKDMLQTLTSLKGAVTALSKHHEAAKSRNAETKKQKRKNERHQNEKLSEHENKKWE